MMSEIKEDIADNLSLAESNSEEYSEYQEEAATEATPEYVFESSVPDYEKLIEEDLSVLRASFKELSSIKEITELENPSRYAALRDLGLTPEEAYRATSTSVYQKRDNRVHLKSSVPRAASVPASNMSYREMEAAREIFGNISDAEIQRLYKKVTR